MLSSNETFDLPENVLSEIIVEKTAEKLKKLVNVDVVIVGTSISGLTTAWFLALNNLKVVVFDKSFSLSNGVGYNNIILPIMLIKEGEALEIIRNAGIRTFPGSNNIYLIDPLEAYFKIALKAIESGAYIWINVEVVDLITHGRSDKLSIHGVMINRVGELFTEPLYIYSKVVVDATEYDARIIKLLIKRHPELKLEVPGVSSYNVATGTREIIEKTGMVVPGLYVVGGSVASLYNINKCGVLINNMVISGRKLALQIIEDLRKSEEGS